MRSAKTIADLAIGTPSSIPILECLGIDYCCHGNDDVHQACRKVGLTVNELMTMIESAPPRGGGVRHWEEEPLTELIAFIIERHHSYTRTTLQTLQVLATKVRLAHGERHKELLFVEQLVAELSGDLMPHMMKEEQILFPYVNSLAFGEPGGSCFGTVRNPIQMMMAEHEVAGETMAAIRALTGDYTTPDDACASYRAFYSLLRDLERDLHRHIHLENNILFPKAIELESMMQEVLC